MKKLFEFSFSLFRAATKFLEDLKETEELEIVDVPSYVFYEVKRMSQ